MTTDDRERAIVDLQRQVAVLEAEVRALRVKLELAFARLDRNEVPPATRIAISAARIDLYQFVFYSWIAMLILVLVLLVAGAANQR